MKHLCPTSWLQNAFTRLTILLLLLVSSTATFSQSLSFNAPGTGSIAILVNILSFSAKQVNDKVFINWSSNKEENLSHYIIERSYNNNSYEQAGLIFTGEKQDSVSSYSFQDIINTANATVIYYRLKMVDKSGTIKYSQVKTIRTEKAVDFYFVKTVHQPTSTSKIFKI